METSPPGSPLSELSSEEFDNKSDNRSMSMDMHHDTETARPIKRLKLTNLRHSTPQQQTTSAAPEEDIDLSSDTSGSVPASPTHPPGLGDEDSLGADQVTVCKWDGCEAGDLGNMDNLVKHLHDEHIDKSSRGQAPSGQQSNVKKYSCEWSDCARKGIPHASGYALRAHMRSHTREKPFYCSLPECDRAFTRSDALAKHMRTVHETEALRPSDPVPKHHSSHQLKQQPGQRIKLVFSKNANGVQGQSEAPDKSNASTPAPNANANELDLDKDNVIYIAGPSGHDEDRTIQFPTDISFTEDEASMPADHLYRLLRRQLHWAQEEANQLKTEVSDLETKRKEAWTSKELVLENAMDVESIVMTLKGIPTGPDGEFVRSRIREDIKPGRALEINGKKPWWREEGIERRKRQPAQPAAASTPAPAV